MAGGKSKLFVEKNSCDTKQLSNQSGHMESSLRAALPNQTYSYNAENTVKNFTHKT